MIVVCVGHWAPSISMTACTLRYFREGSPPHSDCKNNLASPVTLKAFMEDDEGG